MSKWERLLLVLSGALLLVVAARYAFAPMGGYDVFWHLETGEWIWRTKSLLLADPFSFAPPQSPWPFKDAGAAQRIFEGRSGAGLAMAASLVGLVIAGASPLPMPGRAWQEHRYPEGALTFLRQNALVGEPLNDMRWGGYLLYHLFPRYRVVVDGRNELVYSRESMDRAARALREPKAFRSMVERFPIEWLFLHNDPDEAALRFLDRSPDWALVFASEPALVYVKTRGANAKLAQQFRYQVLEAHDLGGSLQRAVQGGKAKEALAEARRMLDEDPASYPASLIFALAQRVFGTNHGGGHDRSNRSKP